MKFVKLKNKFIEDVRKIDSEFMTNYDRPYLLDIEIKGEQWILPLRSNRVHSNMLYNKVSKKYLDISKSFRIINYSIIKDTIRLSRDETKFYQNHLNEITKLITKFNKNGRKSKYAVDLDIIENVQKNNKY